MGIILFVFLFRIKEGIGSCETGNSSSAVIDDNGKYVYLKNIEIAPVSCSVFA